MQLKELWGNVGRFINADDVNIMALMQSGLKGTNLFEYCDNNVVNKEDSNGFYSVKISSFAFAVSQLFGFNSIGLVLVYVGYVKFKRFLLKQYAKIIAKTVIKDSNMAWKGDSSCYGVT